MNIVVCPDKFRGSLTASEVTDIISDALLSINNEIEIIKRPLADGGEGSMEALLASGNGEIYGLRTVDALLRPISTDYGMIDGTAIIESSKIIGLDMLSGSERNPEMTSSYGLGIAIADAIHNGAKRIIVTLGGSATNDCGVGMLSALGWIFLDENDDDVSLTGESLSQIMNIIPPIEKLKADIVVLCDVTNELYGEEGATYTYAPQKGADKDMCERLEKGVRHFAHRVKSETKIKLEGIVGGGAAGGLGAALIGMLGGKMERGGEFIATECALFDAIDTADMVITGEGKIDNSTLDGKVVNIVAKKAKGKRVVAICGVNNNVSNNKLGVEEILTLTNDKISEEEAIKDAKNILRERVIEYFSLSL